MNKLLIIMTFAAISAFPVMYQASAHETSVGAKVGITANLDKHEGERNNRKDFVKRIKNRVNHLFRVGTVTQVNTDGSFTVENKKGNKEMTVKTDTSTTYTKDGQSADKSAVVVGALVNVKGDIDRATKVISAKVVNVFDKLQGIHIKGSVTAISGTSLTVKTDNGTVYTVDQSKAHILHSFWFGTSSDIKVGDTVGVWGTQIEGSNTITARMIRDASAKPSPSPTPTP